MIQYIHVDNLIPADYNPRRLTDKAKYDIKESLNTFGFVLPVVVNINPDRLNVIVGGHQRYTIAKEMGIKEIPCLTVDLPIEKEKELNIRLNKNTAHWDIDKLREVFADEDLTEWGFSAIEIDGSFGDVYDADQPSTYYLQQLFQQMEAPEEDLLGRKKVEILMETKDWQKYNQYLTQLINNGKYTSERDVVYDALNQL